MMYLRYILFGIFYGLMTVIGWFIYPFIYPFYDRIYSGKKVPFWWFLNSDEKTYGENKYGAKWWIKKKKIKLNTKWHRFKASYRWVAVRNSIYTLKLKFVPYFSEPYRKIIYFNITNGSGMEFCNEKIHGWLFITFTADEKRHFRMSATFKLLWWVQNFQLGMSEKRHLYKLRFWSKKDIVLIR